MPPWNGDVRRPSISLKTEVSSSSSPSLGMRREGVAVYEQTCEIYNRVHLSRLGGAPGHLFYESPTAYRV